jgi:Mrp family chromosome partitioning ATPase
MATLSTQLLNMLNRDSLSNALPANAGVSANGASSNGAHLSVEQVPTASADSNVRDPEITRSRLSDASSKPSQRLRDTKGIPPRTAGGKWSIWKWLRTRPQLRSAPTSSETRRIDESADEFALLASQIVRWSRDGAKGTILITSALEGEGKTFVALNLGIMLARTGGDVVLVDANTHAPSLHTSLKIFPRHGLAGYMTGSASLADCLYATSTPNLRLLPADETLIAAPVSFVNGQTHERFGALRRFGGSQYVLIDAGPLLAAPETRILAGVADAVLMVVAANSTPQSAFQKALQLLNDVPLLGVVLNRFEPPLSSLRSLKRSRVRGK